MVPDCSKDATDDETSASVSASASASSSCCRCWSSACFGLSSILSDDDENEQENCRSKEKSTGHCEQRNTCLRMNKENPEDDASELKPDANLSNRSCSRHGFGFRLGRTASLGSSNSQNLSIPYHERTHHRINWDSISSEDHRTTFQEESVIDGRSSPDIDLHNLISNFQRRHRQRKRVESSEGTARFSRSLSVGRLRDRVHRLEGRHGPLVSEEGYIRQGSARRYLTAMTNISLDDGDLVLPSSDNPLCSITRNAGSSSYNHEPVTLPLTDINAARAILEHRSDFLERRRRIRSQVQALQRLSSRFENTRSGHERSCVLSGQHRTGRCTCRTNSRSATPGDDTNTSASISRIVMLAEELFEVLDEIHQQAVVLTSRPSLSSIGSVSAPKEVIDSMPLRTYTKLQKQLNNDTAQCCYICLVEYEEGDSMRILPCHHEFHRDCVDKWLKEIHRVCPLCRGDVCISALPPVLDGNQEGSRMP